MEEIFGGYKSGLCFAALVNGRGVDREGSFTESTPVFISILGVVGAEGNIQGFTKDQEGRWCLCAFWIYNNSEYMLLLK